MSVKNTEKQAASIHQIKIWFEKIKLGHPMHDSCHYTTIYFEFKKNYEAFGDNYN